MYVCSTCGGLGWLGGVRMNSREIAVPRERETGRRQKLSINHVNIFTAPLPWVILSKLYGELHSGLFL